MYRCMYIYLHTFTQVDAPDFPAKDINISGRRMPLELRLIVWNLKDCAPKDGYTSNVRVVTQLLGWGKEKETDTDMGVGHDLAAGRTYVCIFVCVCVCVCVYIHI